MKTSGYLRQPPTASDEDRVFLTFVVGLCSPWTLRPPTKEIVYPLQRMSLRMIGTVPGLNALKTCRLSGQVLESPSG